MTAEAPVAWPSGAFVRVDRLDKEARTGIERSARFAAAIGSPVLTIHLFIPMTPQEFRHAAPLHEPNIEEFLQFFAGTCLDRGVTPLIENVPPVLRMRSGGFFLSPIGGHWRDLLAWGERVVELGFTLDTSHAALFGTSQRPTRRCSGCTRTRVWSSGGTSRSSDRAATSLTCPTPQACWGRA